MGHHIRAIIGSPSVVARAREHGLNCAPIPLDAGLAWVPVLAEDLDRLAETSPLAKSDWEDAFELFGGVLPAMLRELSMHGPVAYIETEYFGGLGDQVGTAFDQGARVVHRGSVNEALRSESARDRAWTSGTPSASRTTDACRTIDGANTGALGRAARLRDAMGADETDEDLLTGYRRYRSRTTWALWTMVLGLALCAVFWRAEAWNPSGLAELARGAGAGGALLAAVLAFRWNAMLAERIGYCRGKHGCHPRELSTSK